MENIQLLPCSLCFEQMHREVRMSVSQIYPHRRNKDGFYDSICLTCFLTVAHANTEAELRKQEMAHACHAALLSRPAIRSEYALHVGF